MAGTLQLVARLESVTGLSEDIVENVIHVGFDSGYNSGDEVTAMESFRDFWLTTHGAQTSALAAYVSDSVSRASNKCHILAYETADLTGATPFGSPIGSIDFTMAASGTGDSMPEEVAAVISFNADLTNVPVTQTNPSPPPDTIRPQQRRRGRLYFGPMITLAGSLSGSLFRPTTTFRTNLGASFAGMAQEINALPFLDLGVWSKTDAAVYPVIEGYVDDAWDTQRRRGVSPTLRTAFTI